MKFELYSIYNQRVMSHLYLFKKKSTFAPSFRGFILQQNINLIIK